MRLADHLKTENIIFELSGNTKFQIIDELMHALDTSGNLLDFDTALQDVRAREGYLSTGLENGLAIPHAKTDGVDRLQIALGVKKDGVDFESLDGKPAKLIFLVLSPRNTSGPHIQTLAVISRQLKQQEIREALLTANDPNELNSIITDKFNL